MAGIGAAINTGNVQRDDTVAVIGCGGVGDAAIAGAALVGAKKIIAVDTDNQKLDWAREFGATHTINANEFDVVETIQDLTDGNRRRRRRSTRSADPRPGSRRSTPAIWRAPWCWSGCPPPT